MKKLLLILSIAICSITNAQDTWTQKTNFGGGTRQGATGFSIGSYAYCGLGNNTSITTWYNDFWQWNPATNVWTQLANFQGAARGFAVGFSIGTKGYIGTGGSNTGSTNPANWIPYNDFWEYDPSGNTWMPKSAFPGVARYNATGFSIGTKGYIGTGYDAISNYSDFWEWNQATNTWAQKADFTGGSRRDAVGFSIGSKGYMGTGYDDVSFKKDFWEWDPTTNVWTQKTDVGGPGRCGALGFFISGKGYIGTGYDGSSYRNDFWEWDPGTNVWTARATFSGIGRYTAVGFSIGSKGYVATGSASNFPSYTGTFTNDFWEYKTVNDGVNEINLDDYFSIYPNPSQGNFTLCSEIIKGEISIYNIQGEKIYFSTTNAVKSQIDLRNQPNGIYFINIKTEQGIATKKLIINK